MNRLSPDFKIVTRRSINRLVKLHNELSIVPNIEFVQNHCDACVIGHGIRARVINGFKHPIDDFDAACRWVGLPDIIDSYLFSGNEDIQEAAEFLGLRIPKTFTVRAAQKRIETVLDMCGYELY